MNLWFTLIVQDLQKTIRNFSTREQNRNSLSLAAFAHVIGSRRICICR